MEKCNCGGEHYTCGMCGNTFKKISSDEEMKKEMEEIMPEAVNDPREIVCHDCWLIFMEWFEKLTPEEKKKMHEENLQ